MRNSFTIRGRGLNKWASGILAGLITLIIPAYSAAENIITSGTYIGIAAGTTVVSSESLTIKNGVTFDNTGTLILKKNLSNESIAANTLGAGTIVCSGTSNQSIAGQNIIQNLIINNTAGVSNLGENRVNGTLTLTAGQIILGNNNLTLGSTANIAGTPSATAMIVANGTGEMRKVFTSAGSFTFPVGDNSGIAEYSPVTLNFSSGSFIGGAYASVKLSNSPLPGAPGGSYLNRYWTVGQSGMSGFNCNATFKYVPADVTGTENTLYCVRTNPPSVDYFGLANTTLDQLTANNLTAFGNFTGYQLLPDNNVSLTLLLEGLYNGGGIMRKAQNATGDQFSGSTADLVTIELHQASSYSTIAYSIPNLNLNTSGAISGVFPGILSGSYYVTVKHRNSLETTSSVPVSVSAGSLSYNFTDAASKAYGNNMKAASGGYFLIFGGDVTQDRIVDGSDMALVDNSSTAAVMGYVAEDTTGDGLVDGSDMALIDNNSTLAVTAKLP